MSTHTPNPAFAPGATVTVADLKVGDTIYARHDRTNNEPIAPVEVKYLTPSTRGTGLTLVTVQSPYQQQGPWPLGWLAAGAPIIRAVRV